MFICSVLLLLHHRLSLTHARTLKMSEDVLCVRYSPDGRLLAVALIDSTVKVFFADSLKVSDFFSLSFVALTLSPSYYL